MTHSHLLLPVVVFLGMQLAEEYALTRTKSRGWNEKNNWKRIGHIEEKANTRTGVPEKDSSRAKGEYRKCKDSPQESVMSVLEEGLLNLSNSWVSSCFASPRQTGSQSARLCMQRRALLKGRTLHSNRGGSCEDALSQGWDLMKEDSDYKQRRRLESSRYSNRGDTKTRSLFL